MKRPLWQGWKCHTEEGVMNYWSQDNPVGGAVRQTIFTHEGSIGTKSSLKKNTEASPVKKRILVMDDDEVLRDLLCTVLDTCGYESAPAADGPEAVQLFREAGASGTPFAAVMLDLHVPWGPDGAEVLQELSSIDSGVKAVLISGDDEHPAMKRCQDYGFMCALAKPFTLSRLKNAVRLATGDCEPVGAVCGARRVF
jgi:CheY-like chemotaxis protein